MKARTPIFSLIPLLIFWSGCTSPQVNKSENLPSQLSNDPTSLEEIVIETEPVGEAGIQGIAGIPTVGDTLQPDNSYMPPNLDYNNLQDLPPAQRPNSTDLPNPEHWQTEELIIPQGPVGQPGEPEKIVSADPESEQTHPETSSDAPELAGIADSAESTEPELATSADVPLDTELQLVQTTIPSRPFSPYGEATTRPIFLPSDPARFSLPDLLSWLDRHNIDHPEEFANSAEALNWLRQRLHTPTEGTEQDQLHVQALLAWLDSGNGPSNDAGSTPLNLAASFPWQFPYNSNSDSANDSPGMLSKAALWLHHPSLQSNTQSAQSNPSSAAPSNLSFLQNPPPSTPQPSTNFPAPSVDYTATLRWLQLAAQPKNSGASATTRHRPNPRPDRDHSEALRWLQKASGKRAPLHASILSQGELNP
jgi:hypothetical protein